MCLLCYRRVTTNGCQSNVCLGKMSVTRVDTATDTEARRKVVPSNYCSNYEPSTFSNTLAGCGFVLPILFGDHSSDETLLMHH